MPQTDPQEVPESQKNLRRMVQFAVFPDAEIVAALRRQLGRDASHTCLSVVREPSDFSGDQVDRFRFTATCTYRRQAHCSFRWGR